MFKSRSSKSSGKAAKTQGYKQNYFSNCHRTYSCIHCRAHLANHDELISKLFQGNHGRAYLFNKVVNVGCKQAVQRELLTGLHAVADIYCDSCETTLGWKYEQAFVPSQKYKEGKYIIELVHMLKENDWDLTSYNARDLLQEAERGPECRAPMQRDNLPTGRGSGIVETYGQSAPGRTAGSAAGYESQAPGQRSAAATANCDVNRGAPAAATLEPEIATTESISLEIIQRPTGGLVGAVPPATRDVSSAAATAM